MDSLTNDAAMGARDAAYQAMCDSMASAWHGGVPRSRNDAEAVLTASLATAQETSRQIADSRPAEGETAYREMIAHLNNAWRQA